MLLALVGSSRVDQKSEVCVIRLGRNCVYFLQVTASYIEEAFQLIIPTEAFLSYM